jgi:hypothetical protein
MGGGSVDIAATGSGMLVVGVGRVVAVRLRVRLWRSTQSS